MRSWISERYAGEPRHCGAGRSRLLPRVFEGVAPQARHRAPAQAARLACHLSRTSSGERPPLRERRMDHAAMSLAPTLCLVFADDDHVSEEAQPSQRPGRRTDSLIGSSTVGSTTSRSRWLCRPAWPRACEPKQDYSRIWRCHQKASAHFGNHGLIDHVIRVPSNRDASKSTATTGDCAKVYRPLPRASSGQGVESTGATGLERAFVASGIEIRL